jgi:PAS domain S-box-containing protein
MGRTLKKEKPAPIFEVIQLQKKIDSLEKRYKENELVIREMRKIIRHYYDVIATVNDWIWEVDENARFTFSSPQVKSILGYEEDEILGRSRFELMPKEEGERLAVSYVQMAAKRSNFNDLRSVNVHKSGKLVTLETNGAPFFDEDGTFRGFRGVSRDVTPRHAR